jgi:hypothetical protein
MIADRCKLFCRRIQDHLCSFIDSMDITLQKEINWFTCISLSTQEELQTFHDALFRNVFFVLTYHGCNGGKHPVHHANNTSSTCRSTIVEHAVAYRQCFVYMTKHRVEDLLPWRISSSGPFLTELIWTMDLIDSLQNPCNELSARRHAAAYIGQHNVGRHPCLEFNSKAWRQCSN